MINHKYRILIIIDVENWIFHKHALFLQKRLENRFFISIQTQNLPVNEAEWDLIYPLEWNLSVNITNRNKSKWVTGIRSHISWNRLDRTIFSHYLRENFNAVHAVSMKIIEELNDIQVNLIYLTHGIDLDVFNRKTPYLTRNGPLRVGWAGNKTNPNKGFESIIKPATEMSGGELVFFAYGANQISQSEMVNFYESIDVFLCASESEGNSNTLLEAAAMGVPIITTKVGTVQEYLINNESAVIVERNVEEFSNALKLLAKNPSLRTKLSSTCTSTVKQFDWKLKLKEHEDFFLNNINQ